MNRLFTLLVICTIVLGLCPSTSYANAAQSSSSQTLTDSDYKLADLMWDAIKEEKERLHSIGISADNITDSLVKVIITSPYYKKDSLFRNGDCFRWMTTDGISCLYIPNADESEQIDLKNTFSFTEEHSSSYSLPTRSEYPVTQNVCFFQPFYGDPGYTYPLDDTAFSDRGVGYTNIRGIDVTVKKIAEALESNTIVIIDGHGTISDSSKPNTSYIALRNDDGLEKKDYKEVSGPFGKFSHATYGKVGDQSVYLVDGTIIAKHMKKNAPNNLLWLSTCNSMDTDGIYAPLRAKGVEVVYGYTKDVSNIYNLHMLDVFLSMSLDNYTVKEIIRDMKKIVGAWDQGSNGEFDTLERAKEGDRAFPVVVSSKDPYPGLENVNNLQTVQTDWCLRVCVHNYLDYPSISVPATCIMPAHNLYRCTKCNYGKKSFDPYSLSDWDSIYPAWVDPELVETKTQYRYEYSETITSEEPSLSGYTLIGSEWVEKSSGSHEYFDNKYLEVFDKSHSLYSQYGKAAMEAYEGEVSKREINEATENGSYIYYHWCHGGDYNGPMGHEDYSKNVTDTCDTFHAYYSPIDPSASNAAEDGSYKMPIRAWCTVSQQFYRITVFRQEYTEYKKVFTYGKTVWTNWSDSKPPTDSHVKDIQERQLYRYYDLRLGAHNCQVTTYPTIYATGLLEGCKNCSKLIVEILPKLNPTDYTKIPITKPTCTSMGKDYYIWNNTDYGRFTFTQETYATGHTVIIDPAVAPTCTTAGLTEGSHCSVCNAVITAQEVVSPLGHNLTAVVTPPTCTSDGYTTYTCSRCSYSYTETDSGSMGHLYSYAVTSKPNSSSTGTLTGTCSSCANTTTLTLPKLNTTDYTRTIVTAATCTTNGTVNYTWNNTSYGVFSFTLFIYATGHSPVTDVAIAPTCTTAGLTEGSHCFICKEVIIAQETLAPLGHSYTYTNEGDVHTVTCVLCGDTSVKSHSYTDGLCICGEVENTAPVVDESIVINHTLNLASDISVNYVVRTPLLEGYEDYYLEVRVPNYEGNRKIGEEIVEITPVVVENLIYFTLTGVTAVQMNDELLATLYMSKGGKHFISKEDTYSIATYAYNQLNTASASRSLKKLCADLLCYGAAAQNYKGYRTDALVTENMTAEHMTHQSNTEKVTFGKTNVILDDISSPQITWVGKTLSLDSKVIIRFIFDASSYRGKVSDLTLKLNYQDSDGVDQEVSLTDPTVYNGNLNLYCFDLDMLMAAELRTTLNVAVYEGEVQLSQTLRYSPDTYGNNKTGTLLAVCKALFAYSDSANAYFAN